MYKMYKTKLHKLPKWPSNDTLGHLGPFAGCEWMIWMKVNDLNEMNECVGVNLVHWFLLTCRTFRCLGARVSLGILLLAGLPVTSFRGRDCQSDREHAWILNPACIPQTWDSHGNHNFAFLMALLTGQWMASQLWSVPNLLENILTGYYLLLMDIAVEWNALGDQNSAWPASCLARITCKNLLFLAGHLAERIVRFDGKAPWMPSKTMEDAAEHHFGRTKAVPSNWICIYLLFMFYIFYIFYMFYAVLCCVGLRSRGMVTWSSNNRTISTQKTSRRFMKGYSAYRSYSIIFQLYLLYSIKYIA